MRLMLKNWPPLASHCLFLIMGLAVAHLSPKEKFVFDYTWRKKVIIPLNHKALKNALVRSFTEGEKLYVVEVNEDRFPQCKISKRSVTLIQNHPLPFVATDQKDALSILRALARKDLSVSLAPLSLLRHVEKCGSRPEIHYGQGGKW